MNVFYIFLNVLVIIYYMLIRNKKINLYELILVYGYEK